MFHPHGLLMSAIRLQGARHATSTLEHPVTYKNNHKESGTKLDKSATFFGEKSHSSESVGPRPTRLRPSWTCLLSIVVSRPVQIASHRGVIQESLVCTARHPTLMWNSQVFDSSTESYRCLFPLNLSRQQPITALREPPPTIWQQLCQIYPNMPNMPNRRLR